MESQEINESKNIKTLPKRSSTPGEEVEELSLSNSTHKTQFNYKFLIFIILAVILAVGSGLAVFFFWWLPKQPHETVEISTPTATTAPVYSAIDGLPLSDPAANTSPVFCIQVPNGADGARPQAGLTKARVV